MSPRLSIIIPFYDDGPWIDDALASTEGEADAEVIVVNDNPGPESDALLSALSDHRDFTIVRHDRNRGLAAARNSGMAVASGDYIAFLDADDVLLSGALTAALERRPELIERAAEQNVILASPSTLIGLLRAVAVGWREHGLAEEARELISLGRELHERAAVAFETPARSASSPAVEWRTISTSSRRRSASRRSPRGMSA